MADSSAATGKPARGPLHRTTFLLAALCVLGGLRLLSLHGLVDALPIPGALSFLTIMHDGGWLLFVGLLLSLLLMAPRGLERPMSAAGAMAARSLALPRLEQFAACAVVLIAAAGAWIVMHRYVLSLDEFLALFQADLILQGWPFGRVPEDWRWIQYALQPIFMHHDSAQGVWGPRYLPVNGLLIAPLRAFEIEWLLHPALAGASVLLLARVAREVLPGQTEGQRIAVVLLATSPQFLLTAMTPYAMTTHLFFNLLWLWLMRQPGSAWQVAAAAAAVLATGIHQVHNFPAFAMPFLLAAYLAGQRRRAVLHGIVLAAAIAFWIAWRDIALWAIAAGPALAGADAALPQETTFFFARALSLLESHGFHDVIAWALSLLRFIAWQNPLLIVLVCYGLACSRRMPKELRPFAWSCMLSLVPYVLFITDQGHGWGYRYIHGLLGNMALLAAWGWTQWRAEEAQAGRRRAMAWAGCLTAAVLAVAVPLRAQQASAVVQPYADAYRWLLTQPADIVVVADAEVWYGADLVRSDVRLERRPRIAALTPVAADIERLCRHGRVSVVGWEDLSRFGLRQAERFEAPAAPPSEEARRRLKAAGCYREPVT